MHATGFRSIAFPDGRLYHGECSSDGVLNGRGKLTWPSGDVYEGNWIDDKMNGRGKLVYSNGDTYDGDFLNDKRHGLGKYTCSGGEVFNGLWKDNNVM